MQVDMHYYGVYCIARAAGIKREAAKTIAYTSQYVDDSIAREIIEHENGSKAISVATAHHGSDLKNIDHIDQRYIWVPFHFIPGGKGNLFTEKLICHKDSKIVNEMLQEYIKIDRPYILELLGIATHVYADTFAHYGFSGVSSRKNRVLGSSLKIHGLSPVINKIFGKKIAKWFKKYGDQGGLLQNIRSIMSGSAELTTGALGHGGVSIYPDQPYLSWEFEYEYKTSSLNKKSKRNNQETYLEGCIKIHQLFLDFLEYHPEYHDYDTEIEIDTIIPYLKEILSVEGDKHERTEVWKNYAKAGKLFNKKEKIPLYDSNIWQNQYVKFSKLTNYQNFVNLNIYKFFQAASYHKHYTLRELLPKHGMIII